MSRRIELWELSHLEQDKLYIDNICPKCGANIIQREMNEDYATWLCGYCDIHFWVE